jgi:membrane protein DedA with SNARE-associated domain
MDIPQLIQQYGYFAVAIGAFLEGETVLLVAAISARLGYLELPAVLIIAGIAAFLGDSTYFFAGRLYGRRLMQRFPKLGAAVPKVDRFVGRWHVLAVVLLRFTYGLRIAGPIVLGAGRMRTPVYLAANAAGATLWAIAIGSIGYVSGHAALRLLADFDRYDEEIAGALIVIVIVLVPIVHLIVRRRRERREREEGLR